MPFLNHPPVQAVIQVLPVTTHSVEVRSSAWRADFELAHQQAVHEAIFAGRATVRISRGWLRETADLAPTVRAAAILMWGYTSGARGGRERQWIERLPEIALMANNKKLAWTAYEECLRALGCLGISTISKLAYGFGCTFGGLPALILDRNVMGALNAGRWVEMAPLSAIRYKSASRRYLDYLELMTSVSSAGGYTAEQLEFFLFSLGESF
jgi:hypothetical protein